MNELLDESVDIPDREPDDSPDGLDDRGLDLSEAEETGGEFGDHR